MISLRQAATNWEDQAAAWLVARVNLHGKHTKIPSQDFFLLPKLISTILNATNFMPQFEEEKKLLNIWLKEKNIYFEYIKTEA